MLWWANALKKQWPEFEPLDESFQLVCEVSFDSCELGARTCMSVVRIGFAAPHTLPEELNGEDEEMGATS